MSSAENVSLSTQGLQRALLIRLIFGMTVLVGAALFLLGTSWDIQWHTEIGRDRTLIPPHLMMLAGVTLSGIAALISILGETVQARRIPALARYSTRFAQSFQSSLGAYIAGYFALAAAVAFPLDSYWHALFGIDVAIWAPFHIMFISGMAFVALGAAYMLVSVAHMGESLGARNFLRIASCSVILAFASCLGLLTLLLFDAIHGPLFPIMATFLSGWLLIAVKYAVPWRWSATLVGSAYVLFAIIVLLFVPVATDSLVVSEQLAYLRGGPGAFAVVALRWPLAPLILAIGVDELAWIAKKAQWSTWRLSGWMALIVLGCGLWMPLGNPAAIVPEIIKLVSLRGSIILLFAVLGAYGGVKTGQHMGISMRHLEGAN